MKVDLHERLREAAAAGKLPSVTAYNRIDGPGSSLDLREFQQTFWSLSRIPKDPQADPAAAWTRGLPRTVGITINVGTRVEARPFKPGFIAARSYDYHWRVSGQPGRIPATQRTWLLKIMELHGLSGVEFALRNTHPGLASSGLGGSATATTAVCLLANALAGRPFSPVQLVAMASRMEQDLGVSITGTQEQSNVAFGGVTDYVWFPWGIPGRPESGYGCSVRYELIPEKDYPELEQRMAIFHTGKVRASTDVNAVWTKKLATRAGHELHARKLELAYRFREGLRRRDWDTAIATTEEYRRVRTRLCPAYMLGAGEIHRSARNHGGAAFPLGAGGGGAVLALCSEASGLAKILADLGPSYHNIAIKILPRGHDLDNLA
jgi:galactokinase/mevalonate kinase-like predicted kinase